MGTRCSSCVIRLNILVLSTSACSGEYGVRKIFSNLSKLVVETSFNSWRRLETVAGGVEELFVGVDEEEEDMFLECVLVCFMCLF